MARKENKGGILHNEDIEQELRTRGGEDQSGRSYRGSQDTGDDTVRPLGTAVQRNDGLAAEDLHGGEESNKDPE